MEVKKINELFCQELVVINMGLESFSDSLKQEEVKNLQMNWRPPAGGDERLIAMLDKLER